jgi:hypothetical protein
MFFIIGWKRMEVNRVISFASVTEATFPSILRRAFVCPSEISVHGGLQLLRQCAALGQSTCPWPAALL